MAGPITHAVTTRLLGLPVAGGIWPDLVRTREQRELTHGLPGLALACILGQGYVLAWALHMAIDTLTHDPGEGAVGQRKWFWLP